MMSQTIVSILKNEKLKKSLYRYIFCIDTFTANLVFNLRLFFVVSINDTELHPQDKNEKFTHATAFDGFMTLSCIINYHYTSK